MCFGWWWLRGVVSLRVNNDTLGYNMAIRTNKLKNNSQRERTSI